MSLIIAGYGYVGKAIHETFKDIVDCTIVDPAFNNNRMQDFAPTHVIIAVSTPEAKDGSCDMSNVLDVLQHVDPKTPTLIKSTISVEGWREIKKSYPDHRITFSPEFLRAKTATQDFQNTQHIYLAGHWSHAWIVFFKKRFPTIHYSIRKTPEELILAKYFRNAYLANKVTFFNQVYDLCDRLALNYQQVREVVSDDPRIGWDHTEVTEERGYGGHCLPKDTRAIVNTAKQVDVKLSLIEEATKYNKKIRKH